jgi:hypothetical protein
LFSSFVLSLSGFVANEGGKGRTFISREVTPIDFALPAFRADVEFSGRFSSYFPPVPFYCIIDGDRFSVLRINPPGGLDMVLVNADYTIKNGVGIAQGEMISAFPLRSIKGNQDDRTVIETLAAYSQQPQSIPNWYFHTAADFELKF